MLEHLDDVDWPRLHHAYGPADDVPGLLRSLISTEPTTRDQAWGVLYGNVIHQGTVWQVTPHVVPFLLEILEGGGPDPHRVLRYLAALVEGDGDGTVIDDPELEAADAEPELARHARAPHRTREAVLRGVGIYRRYLASTDARCRAQTARLLAFLSPDADVLDALADRYGVETDEVARGATLWSIRLVTRREPRPRPGLGDPLESPSLLLRLVESLTKLLDPEPPTGALEVIAAVLANPSSVPRYDELPQRRFRVELDIAHVIRASPPFVPGALLPALLATMHRTSDSAPFVASDIADAILHLVFEPIDWKAFQRGSRRERRPIGELSALRRDVLRELLRARGMWGPPGRRNGNLGASLNPRRLPNSWEELNDYLASAGDA